MNKEAFKILTRSGLGLLALMLFVFITINAVEAAEYKEMEQCWTAPTERESGKKLPIEEIAGFQIAYDYSGDGQGKTWNWDVNRDVLCVRFTPIKANEVCFSGTTKDTGGLVSKLSIKNCKTPVEIDLLPDPPKAPTFLDIMISKLRTLFKKYI